MLTGVFFGAESPLAAALPARCGINPSAGHLTWLSNTLKAVALAGVAPDFMIGGGLALFSKTESHLTKSTVSRREGLHKSRRLVPIIEMLAGASADLEIPVNLLDNQSIMVPRRALKLLCELT
jgi:hypothetical protein